MTEVRGLCVYCGKPAKYTCLLCGFPVCEQHIDHPKRICLACKQGKKA